MTIAGRIVTNNLSQFVFCILCGALETCSCSCLSSGDTSYSLAEAQNLRMQLTKLYESLSALRSVVMIISAFEKLVKYGF